MQCCTFCNLPNISASFIHSCIVYVVFKIQSQTHAMLFFLCTVTQATTQSLYDVFSPQYYINSWICGTEGYNCNGSIMKYLGP